MAGPMGKGVIIWVQPSGARGPVTGRSRSRSGSATMIIDIKSCASASTPLHKSPSTTPNSASLTISSNVRCWMAARGSAGSPGVRSLASEWRMTLGNFAPLVVVVRRGPERIRYTHVAELLSVLEVLAEQRLAAGQLRGRQDESVPPGEAELVLQRPGGLEEPHGTRCRHPVPEIAHVAPRRIRLHAGLEFLRDRDVVLLEDL